MSAVLHITTPRGSASTLHAVQSAVQSEILRCELALESASKRLQPFEERYQVSSEVFYTSGMAAEDLIGGDDEYIRWAGEYEFFQQLQSHVEELKALQYEY
jgi:hypothetical protein